MSLGAEEVLTSLLGAMVVGEGSDRDALIVKAAAEVLAEGQSPEAMVRLVATLWKEPRSLLS